MLRNHHLAPAQPAFGALERKDAEPNPAETNTEVKKAFGEFLKVFEDYQKKNDERLVELEKKKSTDPITEDTLKRINDALDKKSDEIKKLVDEQKKKSAKELEADSQSVEELKKQVEELQVKMARPGFGENGDDPTAEYVEIRGRKRALTADELKHRELVHKYMRTGDAGGLSEMEKKAISNTVGTDPEGGYLTGTSMETEIDRLVSEVSPMRQVATIRQTSHTAHKVPYNKGGSSSGWVAETGSRPQTDASTLALREFPTMELYAMPAASQSLLDDGVVDIEAWMAEEVQTQFAEQEGAAFITGNGVASPRGILDYATVADANWVDEKLGYIASGAAADFASANPLDKFLDVVHAPKAAFRQNSRWMLNRSTLAKVRKFKDGEGNYMWQPSNQAGQPSLFMGYPVLEAEDMDDVGANAFPIAFGDFRRGYIIVDRVGVRILRDPYSSKPYILFYTTKRVGGGVKNFEAIKLMKIATS